MADKRRASRVDGNSFDVNSIDRYTAENE